MIILDIPQGVITFASAFLASLVAIVVAAFGFMLSVHGRLKAVETQVTPDDAQQLRITNARMEILWERYIQWTRDLRAMGAPENPMKQERWDELADKLHEQKLSDDEAEEFLAALLKREEQAREEKDLAALVILGSGIILTKWQLKEKELREQK